MDYRQWQRQEVIRYVRLMADPQEAHRTWVEGKLPEGMQYDNFNAAFDFFFDDVPFECEYKEQIVGYLLENDEEWDAILSLRTSMRAVIRAVGPDAPDEEYLNHEKWASVVAAAQKALKVLAQE